MRAAGIEVVAITSCPGDNKALIEEKEGLSDGKQLQFAVLGDKTWIKDGPQTYDGYTIDGLGDFWTTKPHPMKYEMVQPAVVVLDADGKLVAECAWSWKTMGKKHGKTYTNELDRVPSGSCYPPSAVLVMARPLIKDLLPSIQERRAVAIAPTQVSSKEKYIFWCCNHVCCCCVCLKA